MCDDDGGGGIGGMSGGTVSNFGLGSVGGLDAQVDIPEIVVTAQRLDLSTHQEALIFATLSALNYVVIPIIAVLTITACSAATGGGLGGATCGVGIGLATTANASMTRVQTDNVVEYVESQEFANIMSNAGEACVMGGCVYSY